MSKPTAAAIKRNIRAFVRKHVAPSHSLAGARWYAEAHARCHAIALQSGHAVPHIVGALAALSPQTPWEENVQATKNLAIHGAIGTTVSYPYNQKKAERILRERRDPLTVLGGEKVLAFYDNILYPHTSRAVVVDTHIARVALNTLALTEQQIKWVFRRKTANRLIQNAFHVVAIELDLLPSTLQATCWLAVKDRMATTQKGKRV